MPVPNEPAPDYVPAEFKKQWEEVYKSAFAKAKSDGKPDKDAEESAFAQANGVIKKRKEKASEVTMSEQDYATVGGKQVHKSDFGYAPGDKPSEWKFPLDDEGRVRDAMARFNQEKGIPADAMRTLYHKILGRAHKYGMDTSNFEKEHGGAFKGSEVPQLVWPMLSEFGERKRIPIALTGTWVQGDRKFNITREHLDEIIRNFEARKNGEVNMDYDHASEQPEVARGGDIPSAGRIVAIDPPEPHSGGRHMLWGHYEPTERAASLIKNREYRYISPAINFAAKDKGTGKPVGAALTSVALTNRPFLEELPEVRLSDPAYQLIDTGSVHVDGADPDLSIESNQPGAAGKEKKMKKLKVRNIKAADSAEHAGKRGVFDEDGTMMGLADVEPDADDPKLKGAEERFAMLLTDYGFEGQNEDQVRAMIESGMRAQERDQKESSRKALLSECIIGMGLDEEKAANLLADGKVNKADYNAAREAQRRVGKAMQEGRLLPRNGGQALRLFLSDADLFKSLIEEGKPRLPLKPVGATRGAQTTSEDFLGMVKGRQEEKKCEYAVALSEVSREHPEMARAYRESVNAQSA